MTARDAGPFTNPVRDDFVPKDDYVSREFLLREKEKLWPHLWQVACREEEVSKPGDYVTYDIHDDSIVVVRTEAGRLKAYHNACMHRGRRITTGAGRAGQFRCAYHGWRWSLDGAITYIQDEEDWKACSDMQRSDLALRTVHVDTWAGFVFISMEENPEPLQSFLDPVPSFAKDYEFEKLRYRWYVSVKLPCNWKVALEAFNEGYHVAATHPQLLEFSGDDRTRSFTHGKHGMFGYYEQMPPRGAPSPRTGKPVPKDLRQGIVGYIDLLDRTLKAIYTPRSAAASRRILSETPADAPLDKIISDMQTFQREAALADGAGWPPATRATQAKIGSNWHIFPNLIFLPYFDGALFYRSRPNRDDPDTCIYDIWSLARYAPGSEPTLERQYFYGDDDWKSFGKVSLILQQDFDNMVEVQRGMKVRGFAGSRTNPRQETSVSNMHRVLHEYLSAR